MRGWFKLLFGLLLIAVPVVVAVSYPIWLTAVVQFLMGVLLVIVAIAGLTILAQGLKQLMRG